MSFKTLSDESLILFYENIRQQVEADRAHKHKFMSSPTIREYAENLQREIISRRLPYSPISWP